MVKVTLKNLNNPENRGVKKEHFVIACFTYFKLHMSFLAHYVHSILSKMCFIHPIKFLEQSVKRIFLQNKVGYILQNLVQNENHRI